MVYFIVSKDILVASPLNVAERLADLIKTQSFWMSAFFSLLRIMSGYFISVIVGTALAVVTSGVPLMDELFKPMITLVRSTPVASFILLALVWLKRDSVAVFISFLMVLPIVWQNVSQGIKETDASVLEMAHVYNFSFFKKVKTIYFHSVFPYFIAGCTTALGLSWKAGIAAEVLSTPLKSIGYNLYRAKINIETVDLFAWSAVIILLSVMFEKIMTMLFGRLQKRKIKEGR